MAMFGDMDEAPVAVEQSGPELVGRYRIPLFWLAAFAPSDVLRFDRRDEDGEMPVTIYCSPTDAALARLEVRTPVVLAIAGEAFAGFYREWIDYVARSFPHTLLLQPEEILILRDVELSNRELAAAIEAFDTGEDAKPRDRKLWRIGALPFEPSRHEAGNPEQAANWCRGALAGSDWLDAEDAWPPEATAGEVAAMAAFAPGAARRPWWKFWS